MAVRKESVYKADLWEGEDNGVHLVEQEAERPEKTMSRKERKISSKLDKSDNHTKSDKSQHPAFMDKREQMHL